MRRIYTPPHLGRFTTAPMAAAAAITLLIFMILPFTQMLSNVQKTILTIRQIEIALPPPPPPPKQPPPEEQKREEKPEMKDKLKPLTLAQLEVALNPGTGGALAGDFGFGFGGFEVTAEDVMREMKIFQLSEVDKEPQILYQAQPNYPPRLYRDRIGGTVVILFVVDENGNVTMARVRQSSRTGELDEAAMAAVRKFKFSPGIKDGRPVPVWFEVPIVFNPTR
jgi:protein TonB